MNIKTFVFNPFFENTYVLFDDQGQAIIVDPGCYEKSEQEELIRFVEEKDLNVIAVVNTHCHIDHVLGNYAMVAHFNVDLWVPVNERETYQAIPAYAPSYGFTGYTEAMVGHWFDEGMLSFGELNFQMIEVPGHSPGSMIFYHEPTQVLIGGDVLFRESIGRTDLPGGNHADLLQNIREKVYTLPDTVTVYPGHGVETTIGHEKKFNPFVNVR